MARHSQDDVELRDFRKDLEEGEVDLSATNTSPAQLVMHSTSDEEIAAHEHIYGDGDGHGHDAAISLGPQLSFVDDWKLNWRTKLKKFFLSKRVFLPGLLFILLLLVIFTAKPMVPETLIIRSVSTAHTVTHKLEPGKVVAEVRITFTKNIDEIELEDEGDQGHSGEMKIIAPASIRPSHNMRHKLRDLLNSAPRAIKNNNETTEAVKDVCFRLEAHLNADAGEGNNTTNDHVLAEEKLHYRTTTTTTTTATAETNEEEEEEEEVFVILHTWCEDSKDQDIREEGWITEIDLGHYSNVTNNLNVSFYQLVFYSPTSPTPIGFLLHVLEMGKSARYQLLLGSIILVLVYAMIVFELVHRTIAAMLGAFFVLGVISQIRGRPTLETIVEWIDPDIEMLLFGMMVVVAIFSKTGCFEWVAVKAYKVSKGKKWLIYLILSTATATISAFLDNVTTMLLICPVSIRLCEVLGIEFVPLLLSEVLLSNIGGTATLIGDPPNILIGQKFGLSFGAFIANLTLPIVLCAAASFAFIRFYFRKQFAGGDVVCDISELERQYQITDKALLAKALPVLTAIILMFFLSPVTHLSASWVAFIGATILFLIGSTHEIESVLHKVEWSTLLFFGGLFITMKGIEILGVVGVIADVTAQLIQKMPSGVQLAIALVVIIWVSAFTSAFIDNIPYTATMIPVVRGLSKGTGLPLRPLAWSLAMGACLGGNGTIIGASANVITVGIAEHHGRPISFVEFFKAGFPVMIITISICTVWLLIVYAAIGIH